MLSVVTVIITLGIVIYAVWNFKNNVKEKPQSTVIVTLAIFVFLILMLTVLKTYNDYQLYISAAGHSSEVVFALLTDFLIIILGGLILYLKNFMFLNTVNEEERIRNLGKYQKEKDDERKKDRPE